MRNTLFPTPVFPIHSILYGHHSTMFSFASKLSNRASTIATSKLHLFKRSKTRFFSTASQHQSSSTSSRWIWALLPLGLSAVAYYQFKDDATPKTKQVEEIDLAKSYYLSCLGQKVGEPLPEEDAVLAFVPQVPPPITRTHNVRLKVDLNTSRRVVPIDGNQNYEIWAFNGGAPGPVIRARVGDILDVSFTNNDDTGMWHNIDFHAASGPGGGAGVLTAEKGETRSAQFKLLYPGLFIYHCAVDPVAYHIANGMYGVILVEPEGGLPKVDKEFVVVQSEFYAGTDIDPELNALPFDSESLENIKPRYVVFNGKVGAMVDEPLKVSTGERVRLFFGNAGPNLISSFHIIGTIFDKMYREADLISPPARGIQSTTVPCGGATVVEFVPPTPGTLTIVDHCISRIDQGAVGFINVEGPVCPAIYHSDLDPRPCKPCKIHP